jgi:CheY-like chemotaxis protein
MFSLPWIRTHLYLSNSHDPVHVGDIGAGRRAAAPKVKPDSDAEFSSWSHLQSPQLPQVVSDKKIIIVVDDHAITRNSLALLLRDKGYDARTAPSGRAALHLIKELYPTLVILDLRMADMNGLDVLRQIQAGPESRATQVIIFTGERESEAKAASLGATGYVVKSSQSMPEFWQLVDQAMGGG